MSEAQVSCSRGCSSSEGPKLIFACSGCAEVGELSDQAARQLNRDGLGKMTCLAGVGARINGFIKSTEAAAKVLAIDGCKLHCTKKTLEEAGLRSTAHLCLEDIGFEKGSTEINKDNVAKITQQATALL